MNLEQLLQDSETKVMKATRDKMQSQQDQIARDIELRLDTHKTDFQKQLSNLTDQIHQSLDNQL